MLDESEDGFVTANEFMINLDKIVIFSQVIKEALFSYFDSQKIGMIDY